MYCDIRKVVGFSNYNGADGDCDLVLFAGLDRFEGAPFATETMLFFVFWLFVVDTF